MKLSICALAALALGLICGLSRSLIWAFTYDEAAQLLTDPAALKLSHGLVLVSLLLALLLLWKRWPKGYQSQPPYGSPGLTARLGRMAAGALAVVSGLLMAAQALGTGLFSLIPLLMAVFQTAAGAAMIALAAGDSKPSGVRDTLLLIPTFTSCYWMVAFYHAYGSTPNAETYLYPILAGLVVMACWIFYAGFAFRPGEGRAFAAWALAGLVLIPSALAAPLSLPYRLSLAAQLLWFFSAFGRLSPEPAAAPEDPNP